MTPEELEQQRLAAEAAATASANATAAANAAAEAARANEQQQQQAPVTVDGMTVEQIRARLVRTTELEAAEARRSADVEAARVAGLSEVERANASRTQIETEREAARAEATTQRERADRLQVQIAANTAASELGLSLHPSALQDALALGDFGGVTFNEAREPQNVSETLKDLVKRKPYLLARAEAVQSDGKNAGRDDGKADEAHARRASGELLMGF